MTKECPRCWETKLPEDFYNSKERPDGLYPICKSCVKIANKTARQKRSKKTYEKDCKYCSAPFATQSHKTTHCSLECASKTKIVTAKERSLAFPEKHEIYKQRYYERNRERLKKEYYLKRNTLEGYAHKLSSRTKCREITKELIQNMILENNERCVVSNIPFEYTNRYKSFHNPCAPSIDRIDSTKPYSVDNIQIVLICINKMKSDMPNEDFLSLFRAIKQNG